MPPLYIVQQNAKIRIHNRKVRVEREEASSKTAEVLLETPLIHVSEVVLFGNIGLTTPAIGLLLDQGIPVVFLSESGEYRGQLAGPLTPHVSLRRAQYDRLAQPDFVLKMAQGFVIAKLQHQRALLQRHNRETPTPEVQAAIDQMQTAIESIPRKTGLDSLRGAEGAATAAYFGAFRRFFASEWRFTNRQRRPPPDPVNALLSFGYTLLSNLATGAIQAVGLDPFAGCLHEVVYNRPALALDLVEEFRPVVDGVVLWCCRGGQIRPSDFSPGPSDRPVILSEEGCKRFLQAWEQRMSATFTHPIREVRFPLRQCVIEQARQVAGRFQSGEAGYTAMGFR